MPLLFLSSQCSMPRACDRLGKFFKQMADRQKYLNSHVLSVKTKVCHAVRGSSGRYRLPKSAGKFPKRQIFKKEKMFTKKRARKAMFQPLRPDKQIGFPIPTKRRCVTVFPMLNFIINSGNIYNSYIRPKPGV